MDKNKKLFVGLSLTLDPPSLPSQTSVISSVSPQKPSGEELISRFRILQHQLIKTRGKKNLSVCEIALRERVHVELYIIAQAIAAITVPDIQHNLDSLRREILAEINEQRRVLKFTNTSKGSPITFIPRPKEFKWDEIQITPEVALDSTITGLKVSTNLARKLIKLHRSQVAAVMAKAKI